MATPKVYAQVMNAWVNVIGGAAATAGVTWQNVGPGKIGIAFTAAAPNNGATDAVHLLKAGDAFYDKSGSAACWVKRLDNGQAFVSATAD